MYSVSNLTKDDAFWYNDLYSRCFGDQDPWLEQLDDLKYRGYHISQKVFLIIHVVDYKADILTIGVDPMHRRQGLASALLTSVRALLPAQTSFFLEVKHTNIPAINLYESLGFQQISLRPRYYKDADAIIMSLQ